MPVATVDFECEYDGELIRLTAGRDIVADRHELVRRFPNCFGPDSTSHAPPPRKASAWRGTATPPGRSRQALPERRHRTHHAVAFNRYAWDDISTEVGDGLESGGVLIGTRAPDGSFLVSAASGPGDGAARCAYAIRHDLDRY